MLVTLTRQCRGFTLFGLVVALVLASTLLLLGVPALQNMMARNRQTADLDAIVNGLQTARAFAVSDGEPTTLCGSSTGTGCDGQWSQGWIVVENRSGNVGSVSAGDLVVKHYPALDGGFTLTPQFGGTGYVSYQPSGLVAAGGYFTLCGPRGAANAVSAIVSPAGDVRTDDRTASGTALSCP